MPPVEDFTRMLSAAASGDRAAAEELLPLLYLELRTLAEAQMRRLPEGQTLQPTALVHEAYLRLIQGRDPGWESRNHFFGAAANAMRNILVERARRKERIKHGGGRQREELEDQAASNDRDAGDVLAVHEALQVLEARDPRAAQVVTLRYFGGLNEEEAAAVLGVSETTVKREWRFARSWLYRALADSPFEP